MMKCIIMLYVKTMLRVHMMLPGCWVVVLSITKYSGGKVQSQVLSSRYPDVST